MSGGLKLMFYLAVAVTGYEMMNNHPEASAAAEAVQLVGSQQGIHETVKETPIPPSNQPDADYCKWLLGSGLFLIASSSFLKDTRKILEELGVYGSYGIPTYIGPRKQHI